MFGVETLKFNLTALSFYQIQYGGVYSFVIYLDSFSFSFLCIIFHLSILTLFKQLRQIFFTLENNSSLVLLTEHKFPQDSYDFEMG